MKSIHRLFVTLFFFFFLPSVILFAQDARLATQYMQNGEFEKAAEVYEALLKRSPNNEFYFNNYIECLINLERFDDAIKNIQKEIANKPAESKLYMSQAKVYEKMGKPDQANTSYTKAIDVLKADRNTAVIMANEFTNANKFELASLTLEKAQLLMPNDRSFSYQLGELFRKSGNEEKMIFHYLDALEGNALQLETIKTIFQRFLGDDGHKEVQKQLYERIQKNQENIIYPELLAWLFVLKKDYSNAFRQLRAIDRRLNEDGNRVFNLAYTASFEQEFDIAIQAFDYIIQEKGRNSPYYLEAQKGRLNTIRKKISLQQGGDIEGLRLLESEFKNFLQEYGSNAATAQIISELADLQAYYLNDLEAAIETLNGLLAYKSVNSYILANAKLNLGDFYLMKGDRWEATLLYSQVDKDFGDELLGQEARFRNARLSYFTGDFEWSQSQFNILKSSTSRFIANDAIDLSVFIMDNLGLDSTDRALKLFAEAELLIFQNRFDDAVSRLSDLRISFPDHKLEDDILFLEANIAKKKKEYSEAVALLEKIVEKYAEEVKADDALFSLGDIYENHLNDPDKARQYYERIMLEYSNSLLAIEARKRYRILRGDNI
jgi:tetratricopeptide (TPR) repeat protein